MQRKRPIHNILAKMPADGLVAIMLVLWWVLNVVTGGVVELANDEAYYWWWAAGSGLDWGYYDHPPMVAWLIWLGAWIPGEIGVRAVVSLLQPVGLFLLWKMFVGEYPESNNRKAALLFVMASFAMPLLQLYGLLALPDAPLLFGTVVFLWAIRRMWRRGDVASAVMTGAATALIGYSKYQGIILVVTAGIVYIVAAWQNGNRWKRTAMLITIWIVSAAVLYAPHLIWLWKHDWAPLRYHLAERSTEEYSVVFTLEYLVGLLLLFNPLMMWFEAKGLTKGDKRSFVSRLTRWTVAGYAAFFFVASFKGRTQPQWVLPAVIGVVWLVMEHVARAKSKKAVTILAVLSAVLMLTARVLVMFNPMGWSGELWGNKEHYAEVGQVAKGRPVIYLRDYTSSCKYLFYTGGEACTLPLYFDRDSQWQYADADKEWRGNDVLLIVPEWYSAAKQELADGSEITYWEVTDYVPTRDVKIEVTKAEADDGKLTVDLKVKNPYNYPIPNYAERGTLVRLSLRKSQMEQPHFWVTLEEEIPPQTERTTRCTFNIGDWSKEVLNLPVEFGIEIDGLAMASNSGHKRIEN